MSLTDLNTLDQRAKQKIITDQVDEYAMSSIDEDEPVSPAARLLQAPGFNLYIVAVMGFKTTVTNVDVLKKHLKETLLKHPRFSSVLVMNENIQSWRSTTVDIENHIFMPDLDPNMESPDKFMEDYASSLSTTSMDLTKPLWELHALNVKTSYANSTIIWRFHHSVGDGVSLISLLLACSRKSSDPQSLPTIPCKKQKTFSISNNRFLIWEFLNLIWKNILVILNTLVDCILFVATLLFMKDTQTPIKGPNYGVEMFPKRFVHRILSLEDIKLVKNAMNVTINDVLVGVTQGGLSLYLNRRYEKHNKNGFGNIEKKCHLPKDLRLTAAVIFNNRQSTMIIEDLATLIKKTTKGTWGNVLGYVLIPFTIALQNDPLTYVYRAKTIINRKKISLESKCTFFASQLILKVFGMKLASALMSTVFSNTTLTFSNVAGPQEEITFCGYPISFIAPFVSGIPQALTMHCQSYDKILTISLAVDENVIPDPHQLCDDFVKSLENMKKAVINRGLVKC